MLPEAHLTHQIDGRVRFQIASQQRNESYFAAVESKLAELPAVSRLKGNPLTGSILVIHEGDPSEIAQFAQQNGLFRVVDQETAPAPLAVMIAESAGQWDGRLRRATRGRLDLTSLAFLGFAAAGVIRLARGAVWPAGVSLLWYASELLSRSKGTGGSRRGTF